MKTLLVSGWDVGFEKVRFTLLLKSGLGYRLARAKRITDAILNLENVECEVPDYQTDRLLASMRTLGARCAAAVPVREP